jgi:hypothetical protein|tara:strand:- start:612 stop:3185 length:2574 start_codon:yes stop_codon:yes gene_type:complete
MNTLQRPLFRQAGGPAEMMPAGVAALPQADPAAMVAAVEQTTARDMEKVGQEYVQGVSQGLDDAENFKEVIDSLRGNTMPLEERYLELSEYVGEDDAEKTPESVLAMVQPVIMMTEEGNVDSGIGQLMQKLAGEIDMVTEAGEPTQMGQGLGGLMAANQEVPVQKFANGGIVQHFNPGGAVTPIMSPFGIGSINLPGFNPIFNIGPEELQASRDKRLPMYREALGVDDQKDMTKSQIMFDIAQAGLNFAGGVDPRTGQAMTNRALGSQLAAAASGLPQQIGERVAAGRQLEQQANVAALQAAEAEEAAKRANAAKMSERALSGVFDLTGTSMTIEGAMDRLDKTLVADRENLETRLASTESMFDKEQAQELKIFREDAKNNFKEIDVRFKNAVEMTRIDQANREKILEIQNEFTREMTASNQAHEKYLQNNRQGWQSGENALDRGQKQQIIDLNREKYEDYKLRQPDTAPVGLLDALFDENISFGDYMRGKSKQEILNDLAFSNEFLKSNLAQTSFNNSENQRAIDNYMNNVRLGLDAYQVQSRETLAYLGMFADQQAQALANDANRRGMFGSARHQMATISDPIILQAYAEGASLPYVDNIFSQMFSPRQNAQGEYVVPNIPSYLLDVGQQRRDKGMVSFLDGLQGYAKGGEIKHMANGGDPQGLFNPLTQTYFTPKQKEQPITFDEPIISGLEGVDITKGTGSDAFLKQAANKILTATLMENAPFEETEEAVRTLDSFTQIALTRALESLAGRENRELQERLARLQVPAAEFFYNDSEALAQFRASSRVMDFAIREQESVMQGPGLTRTERNKAKKDLASLKSIRSEYDNLAAAYSRKLEGDTEAVSKQLDQFFN